jgi:hypothetical protein
MKLKIAAVIPGFRRLRKRAINERGALDAVGYSRVRCEKASALAKVIKWGNASPSGYF